MKKFQRILFASGLAATASLMGNSAVFAQAVTGTTATVNLSGTIPSSLTMTVTPTTTASSLPLVPGTEYGFNNSPKIATISAASTNSPGGLKVTVSGSGQLVSGVNSIRILAIEEGFTTTATTMDNRRFIFSGGETLSVTISFSSGEAPDSSIFISYSVPLSQAPGTYTGSLTFTATDN